MPRGPLPALPLVPLALFWALFAPPSASQAVSAEAVNGAIDRGVEFLLGSQNRDGSFGVDLNERGVVWHDLRDGATSLAAYTLLKCGFAPDHPAVQRAAAFLVAGKPRHTYATGIQLHTLGAIDPVAHKKRMQELVEVLLEIEESGGWDYPGIGRPDLSNTQVAALGFRAAHMAGLDLPKGLWGEIVEKALRYQESPREIPGTATLPKEKRRMAGFTYTGGEAPSASMTTAGLTILGIAAEDPARVDHRLDVQVAIARELALNWLEQNYAVAGNPGGEVGWHFYYLYGLERVGALFGLKEIGGHDWYQEGAAELLKEQRLEGGWWSEGRTVWPPAPMPIANTCFALLFLRRATFSGKPKQDRFVRMEDEDSEVWVRVDARKSWTLWLSGFSPVARARFPAGLALQSVEWWIDGELAQTLAADPERAWTDERFAWRFEPRRDGEIEVECRVRVRDGAGGTSTLLSRPVRIGNEYAALQPWMFEYATDAAKNVLAQGFTPSASSEESVFHPVGDVLDGLQGSAWWAKAEDREPWLRLESPKGVRLKELWLSPAAGSPLARGQCVSLERVELRLNDGKEALWIELDPDPMRKTKFQLPKSVLVRRIELRFPDAPEEAGKFVGLAEVEGR